MRRGPATRFDGFVAFYPSTDLAATHDFYVRDLGLELARDQETCRIFKVTGGAYVGFCLHLGPPETTGAVILTLLANDVDRIHEELRHFGAEIEAPPRHNEQFAIYHFFVRDPDGHRVEIQRFDEPLP